MKLKVQDFKKGQYNSYNAKALIWNTDIYVYINFPENKDLSVLIDLINENINWIENNRDNIKESTLKPFETKPVSVRSVETNEIIKIEATNYKYGYLSLAESWVKKHDLEKIEGEKRKCFLIDNEKVFLPLEKDDFCKSMSISSLVLYFSENLSEGPNLTLYLQCKPDYFSGHVICVYINPEKNEYKCGLEG